MEKSSNGSVVQPKALTVKLVEVNFHFQRSVRVAIKRVARCEALKKETALGLFCDSNTQSRHEYFYSNLQVSFSTIRPSSCSLNYTNTTNFTSYFKSSVAVNTM